MRFLMMLIGSVLLGMIVYTQYFKSKPPPPAPPPPPPALTLTPTPVLNAAEIQKVMETTKDNDPNVRWEAIKFLAQLNIQGVDALMSEMLARDIDSTLRKNLVNLIVERKGPAVSRSLVQALHDQSPEVRVTALQALAKAGDYSTAGAISETLQDADERVRLAALSTLNALQIKKNEEIRLAREEQLRQEELRKQAQGTQRGGR